MDLPVFDFNAMSEADVREELLAPLIRWLGYRSGTVNNVMREKSLTYSQFQLGRAKAHDPVVRGRADYVCEAGGAIRWALEAKPPHEALDGLAQAQAFTYANHPEIRAVYFVLCNGRELHIYQTNRGPQTGPFFSCRYEELGARRQAIENLLSPSALIRDHPAVAIDVGVPLASGLRSVARVTGGTIAYDFCTLHIPPLVGMVMTIQGGAVDRDEDGQLRACLFAMVPQKAMQELNEKLGLHEMHLTGAGQTLSIDETRPTVFQSTRQVRLPAGETVLNMASWQEVVVPFELTVSVTTIASGVLRGDVFSGRFVGEFTGMMALRIEGEFQVQLA